MDPIKLNKKKKRSNTPFGYTATVCANKQTKKGQEKQKVYPYDNVS